jgi:hypothetical protein
MITTDPRVTAQRITSRRLLDACLIASAALPIAYRSPGWHALPTEHPERRAALVRAADAWHDWHLPDARLLRQAAELDAIEQAVTDRLKAAATAVADARSWSALGPGHAELHRLRYPWLYLGWRHADQPVEPTDSPANVARLRPDREAA